MLPVLITHHYSLSTPYPLTINGDFIIRRNHIERHKRPHKGVRPALFRFLFRAAQEADFVGVLPRVFLHTLVFQRAEDVRGAVVLTQVVGVLSERLFVALEAVFSRAKGVARGFKGGRLGGGFVGVGKDAIFDKEEAEGAEFVVDPGAEGAGEVGFELVYCKGRSVNLISV